MGLLSNYLLLYYKTPRLSSLKQHTFFFFFLAHGSTIWQGSARAVHLWSTKRQLGPLTWELQDSLPRWHAHIASKVVLSVGWELSQDFELQGLVTFHVVLSVGCLSFLAAWWLGSQNECSTKEPGSMVFYDLASEVILHHFSHNHKIEGGEV